MSGEASHEILEGRCRWEAEGWIEVSVTLIDRSVLYQIMLMRLYGDPAVNQVPVSLGFLTMRYLLESAPQESLETGPEIHRESADP